MKQAAKIYFLQTLTFMLVTAGLFLYVAQGERSNYSSGDGFGEQNAQLFKPFLATMLVYPLLGSALGLVQLFSPDRRRREHARAWTFGLSVLVYVYWFYWIQAGSHSGTLATWKLILVFSSGLLLLVPLVAECVGLYLRGVESGGTAERRVREAKGWAMTGFKVYVLGGLALVLIPHSLMWYQGVSSWFLGQHQGIGPAAAGWIVYPTCIALGTLGVLLAILQPFLRISAPWQVVLAVAYVLGAALFLEALYVVDPSWSGITSVQLVGGLTLFLASLIANLGALVFGRSSSSTQL